MENILDKSDFLKKNIKLKNRHIGKRCFVVGNGPSLKDISFRSLKNEIKICVNSIYKHPYFSQTPPDYWVLADPKFWTEKKDRLMPIINAINSNRIHTKLFLPLQGVISDVYSHYLDLYYYKYDYKKKNLNNFIDFCGEIPPYGENVLIVSLMLAFYLGCNPIYIIGADHSWWAWNNNNIRNIDRMPHFYDEYSAPKKLPKTIAMYQTQALIQKFQYMQIKKYAFEHGFEIHNATGTGELNIFSKVNFDDLFAVDSNSVSVTDQSEIVLTLAKSAIKLISCNDFNASLTLIKQAIKNNLNNKFKILGLNYLRALCLACTGKRKEAIIELQYDCITNPRNRKIASKLLRSIENGDSIENIQNLSPKFELKKDINEAPRNIDDDINAIKNNLYNHSIELLENEKYNDAFFALQRTIEIHPTHSSAHLLIGRLLKNNGQTEKAIPYYAKAFTLKPFDEAIANEYAHCLELDKQFEQAKFVRNQVFHKKTNDTKHSTLSNPNITFIQSQLNREIEDQNDIQASLNLYINQLKQNPKDARVLLALGSICQKLGQYEDARDFYNLAIEAS
jgi:tetratricopeptide (TPR) repeat protein